MQWNDPATSQKEELLFAINEMRECATNGIIAKNAPLFCIVKQGELYAIAGESLSEKKRRAAINLILEACVEANKSGLLKKHTFTAEVVRSLRVLRGNEECIRITRALISGGGKCRHRIAMEQGIYAAIEERDDHSLGMIISAFEESGYDSHRLSL